MVAVSDAFNLLMFDVVNCSLNNVLICDCIDLLEYEPKIGIRV